MEVGGTIEDIKKTFGPLLSFMASEKLASPNEIGSLYLTPENREKCIRTLFGNPEKTLFEYSLLHDLRASSNESAHPNLMRFQDLTTSDHMSLSACLRYMAIHGNIENHNKEALLARMIDRVGESIDARYIFHTLWVSGPLIKTPTEVLYSIRGNTVNCTRLNSSPPWFQIGFGNILDGRLEPPNEPGKEFRSLPKPLVEFQLDSHLVEELLGEKESIARDIVGIVKESSEKANARTVISNSHVDNRSESQTTLEQFARRYSFEVLGRPRQLQSV
jgi:hypothetical protein